MQLICQKYYFFQICDPLPIGPRGSILPQNLLKTPCSQNFWWECSLLLLFYRPALQSGFILKIFCDDSPSVGPRGSISGKTRIHSAKIFVTKKVSGQNYLILKKSAFYRQNCNFGSIWVNLSYFIKCKCSYCLVIPISSAVTFSQSNYEQICIAIKYLKRIENEGWNTNKRSHLR